MDCEMPLFLTNRNWYTTPGDEGLDDDFFDDGRGYHIKDNARKKPRTHTMSFTI